VYEVNGCLELGSASEPNDWLWVFAAVRRSWWLLGASNAQNACKVVSRRGQRGAKPQLVANFLR